MALLALLAWLGTGEMIGIAVVALLIFGKRLPEVARSLGKGVVEFKKGLSGIEDDLDDASSSKKPGPAPEPKPLPEPVTTSAETAASKPALDPVAKEAVALDPVAKEAVALDPVAKEAG